MHAAHRLQRIGMGKRQIEEDNLCIYDFECGDQRRDGGNISQFQTIMSLWVERMQSGSDLTGISFRKQYTQVHLVHARCLPSAGRIVVADPAARTVVASTLVSFRPPC